MYTIYVQEYFAECYPLQIVYYVVLIDLISSPTKLSLFSYRLSEETIFVTVDRKAKIFAPTG